ncbi:MAG: ABC transporter permease [Candidatus Odinarchaeota archaeon]
MTRENKGMFRTFSMVKKEFKIFRTDILNLVITIVLPPILVVFLSLTNLVAIPAPGLQVAVVIQDDQVFSSPDFGESRISNYSTLLIQAIGETEDLTVQKSFNTSTEPYALLEARELMQSRKIDIIIIIPLDFSENIATRKIATVSSIIDSTDLTDTQRRLNLIQESIDSFRRNNGLEPALSFSVVEYFQIPDYQQERAEYQTTIVEFLPFVLFAVSLIPSVLIVVRDKPTKRLLLTPLSKVEVLTAKYITYTIIQIIQVFLIFLVITAVMGLYVEGTLIDLFIVTFIIGYPGVTIGMIISIISQSSGEANQLYCAVLVVNIVLSGLFFPFESMPDYIQLLSVFLPLSHGTPVLRQVVMKGAGLDLLNIDVLSLVLISVFCVIFSYILFLRKKYQV